MLLAGSTALITILLYIYIHYIYIYFHILHCLFYMRCFYFIESNDLRITSLISWIGSCKCPCLQVADGFNVDGNL